MPVSRRECRIKRVSDLPGPQQLDLFGGDRPRVIVATLMWRELPLETRATLTDLMVQLILGHAGANRQGPPSPSGTQGVALRPAIVSASGSAQPRERCV